jgi:hypothetical protein
MILKDIADMVELDISTVSRVFFLWSIFSLSLYLQIAAKRFLPAK